MKNIIILMTVRLLSIEASAVARSSGDRVPRLIYLLSLQLDSYMY